MASLHAALLADIWQSLDALLRAFKLDIRDVRQSAVEIVVIWLLAWGGWKLVQWVASRIVAHADDHQLGMTAHEKRAQTLAQLLRSVGRTVIIALGIILTLDQFLDVRPLLGAVGIVGLAVSFGAQSLVKDVIAGFFILLEDQFAVGDVVDAGGKTGTVERLTLRSTTLRDLDGTLHIVPNGQLTVVSNRTRGWSRAVIDVNVGLGSDVDDALEILRDEANALYRDPRWKPRFDAAPEVVGVQSLSDTSLAIRVLLRTGPGLQWEVGREFRRRIKIRLDREGIRAPATQPAIVVHHHPSDPAVRAPTMAISDASSADATATAPPPRDDNPIPGAQ